MTTPIEPTSIIEQWNASDWALIAGAAIAAFVGVLGYVLQQAAARAERHRTMYAEALRTVEEYLEAPYRIRRRNGTRENTAALVALIGDIQARQNFYCAWLELNAPRSVHRAYVDYVTCARREAGAQMTAAWKSRPTRRDRDMPLKARLERPESDAARSRAVVAMGSRWRRLRNRR